MENITEKIESIEKDLKVLRFLCEKQHKDYLELMDEKNDIQNKYNHLRAVLEQLSGAL